MDQHQNASLREGHRTTGDAAERSVLPSSLISANTNTQQSIDSLVRESVLLKRDSSSSSSRTIAGYTVRSRLGSGSFASVFLGVRDDSIPASSSHQGPALQKVVAIKAISRSEKLSKKILENLEIEISILRNYRHRNIVELYNVEKTKGHYYLILEYCSGGDLQKLIRSRKTGRLSERLSRRLFRDLASGLRFLYERQLLHRDIKPQNLLLSGPLPLDEVEDEAKDPADDEKRRQENFPTESFFLKIADFGFARHLQSTSLAETLCGSPLYMAPEILQHQRYDAKADLWSAGAVLFEMIAGRPPFHGENHIDLLRNIQRRAVRLPPGVKVSPECVTILRLLLNRNPLSRAGFQQFFDSTNAFVSLGCNGPTPQPVPDQPNTTGFKIDTQSIHASMTLDKISEEDAGESGADTSADVILSTSVKGEATSLSRVSMNSDSGGVSGFQITRRGSSGQTPHVFSPLVPSPPGPTGLQGTPGPPTFSLDTPTTISMTNMVDMQLQESSSDHTRSIERRPQHRHPALVQGMTGTSQSDGDEFVMVEHHLQAPTGTHRPLSMTHRRNASDRPGFSQFSAEQVRPRTPPSAFQRFRGLLSTSPGTGGKLMGAMMQQQQQQQQSSFPETTRLRIGDSRVTEHNSLDAAMKMLAVSEDVGRRAVHVAHLGDTRAYMAIRTLMSASMSGSCDCAMKEADDANVAESTSMQSLFRRSSSGMQNKQDDDPGYDDNEMPFAVSPNESTESHKDRYVRQPDSTDQKDLVVASAHALFREALSCYMKGLPLMKGAVTAAKRVLEALQGGQNVDGSPVTDKQASDILANRAKLSFQWLTSQFTGIIERAEAAEEEIKKHGMHLRTGRRIELPVMCVEELIYNHSLACGKDGTVKQVLGQYEAARVSYRSAALLAEILLMERRMLASDRQILEDIVDGFTQRVQEVEKLMCYNNNPASSAQTQIQTATSATGVVSYAAGEVVPHHSQSYQTQQSKRHL